MRKVIHTLARIITFLVILSLIAAYLATWISPAKLWIFAFFGLAYPYLLLVAIMLFVFWLVAGKRKEAILIVFVILLGWSHLNHLLRIPVKPKQETDQGSDTLKQISILTYNVRLFNFYHHEPVNADSMFRFLKSKKADIICLQEIYTGASGLTETSLIHHIGLPYYRFNYLSTGNRLTKYGLAVFSRYPIVNSGNIYYPHTYNATMYCDVNVGSDTLRIFNNHLQSTRLNKHKKSFFSSTSQGESLRDILDISERLRDAFIKRAQQAEILKQKINQSPYRVVVCGDFNDTPVSYTYHKISAKLKDAFLYHGKGLGKTYVGLHPSFRIDYILTSPSLDPDYFKLDKFRYSDHFPVGCSIVIQPVEKADVPGQHSPRTK